MDSTKPPSCGAALFLIGRNRRGQWVAQAQNGLYGGLFINRSEAVRYALFENGHHPEAIITAPDVIELDLSGPAQSSLLDRAPPSAQPPLPVRHAA
ncbi:MULTISPECIES: hypothetical protein [unclassified Bradyrhizobium]|uniref:hypothetical protein n=1 Tax=unclassified Bradyrhizobium TaxID=2631580 RepID=UPI0020131B59|nr:MULTISPECIES: hypothetical protein [unclassified Bradyrhizobium]